MIPEGIVDTLWFDVEERCREFGDEFDAWQDGLGQVMLGLREDGIFAATVGGVAMSIPRQVAKTFIVGRTVVALCSLYPDLTVLWTAHRLRTATMTFDKLKAFVTRASVRPYLEPGRNAGTAIRDANGEQEIPFANGSRIMFGAREQGFGRGFDEVDVEVFDEAQILTLRALEDMVAATNQSRFPHGALLFYMGTPPRPGDPGEMFAARRNKALRAKALAERGDFGEPLEVGDALYVECSADADVGLRGGPALDDLEQVAKANPSFPHRTPPVSVARLRENLPDDDAWRREGLGKWDEVDGPQIMQGWAALGVPDLEPPVELVVGLAGSVDGAWGSIGTAGLDESGRLVVGAVDRRQGQGWLVAEAKRIQDEHGYTIALDEKGPLSDLVDDLEAEGVRFVGLSLTQYVDACQSLWRAVDERRLIHPNHPDLDAAVKRATWRKVGDRKAFGRQAGDVSMLDAVAVAAWARLSATTEAPAIY